MNNYNAMVNKYLSKCTLFEVETNIMPVSLLTLGIVLGVSRHLPVWRWRQV